MTVSNRIAVTRPIPELLPDLTPLFNSESFSAIIIDNYEALMRSPEVILDGFDFLLIAPKLPSKTHPTEIISKVRGTLANLPIVAALPGGSQEFEAFYSAGATFVLPLENFMAGLERLQNKAPAELMVASAKQDKEISDQLLQLVGHIPDALLVFSPELKLMYSNIAALRLLGIEDLSRSKEIEEIQDLLSALIRTRQMAGEKELVSDLIECPIPRARGQQMQGGIRIITICSESKEVPSKKEIQGYVVHLANQAELSRASSMLVQAQRTRRLCLRTYAAALELLEQQNNAGLSSLETFSTLLDSQTPYANIGVVLTELLECVDAVIASGASIKIEGPQNLNTAVKSGDLFEMLGLLLMHAVEFAGNAGETHLSIYDATEEEGVTIRIHSIRRKGVGPLLMSKLQQIFDPEDYDNYNRSAENMPIVMGLQRAIELATTYKTKIGYRFEGREELRLKVSFPPSQVKRRSVA